MDIATLGLKVDGEGGTRQVKLFGEASEKTGRQADQLEATVRKQDQSLRVLAESWSTQNDWQRKSYENYLRQNGLMQRFLEIQRQIDQEMRTADQVAAQYNATQNKAITTQNSFTTAADGSHAAFGRLRGGLQGLATQLTGFNPVVAQTAGVLGSFALGSALTVGILAGMAAIAVAWDLMTKSARETKEASDKAVESLEKMLRLRKLGADAGIKDNISDIDKEIKQQSALASRIEQLPAPQRQGGLDQVARDARAEIARLQAVRDAAQAVVDENFATLIRDAGNAADRAIAESAESVRDSIQRIDDARQKAHDKEVARMEAQYQLKEKFERLAGGFAQKEQEDAKKWLDEFFKAHDEIQKAAQARGESFLSSNGLDGKTLHAQIALNVDEGLKQIEDAKKYAEDVHQIWRQGIGRIVTDGTKSFRDFFEDVLQMFSRLMSRMEQEGKTGGFGYKALGVGSAAISGAFTGYQLGGVAGSANGGAVLGGVGGALTGFQIAGPIGAVVGGLTGLVGGLLGGAQAAREHARALREAARQLQQATLDFHARATGNPADALAAQIAAIKAEAERLKDDYLKVHGGDTATAANKAARDAYFAARDADAAALIAKAQADAAKATKENTDALNKLTNSLGLNIPPGFRYQSLIFQNSAARPWAPGLGGTTSIPFSPSGGLPSYPKIDLSGDLSVSVTLDGNVIGKGVLKRFKDKSQKQFGDSTRWSEIQEA